MEQAVIARRIHRILIGSSTHRFHSKLTSRVWQCGWNASTARWGTAVVETKLHGRTARINFANPYPLALRQYPNYNAPQVEAVLATAEYLDHPTLVVDVGAAVGDTALLLLDRCGSQIGHMDLIEGESSFASILRSNMRYAKASIHEVMLSDKPGPIGMLIRSQHQGTASAEGDEVATATTLDILLHDSSPDFLKIDTDGYDGRILAGASSILANSRPTVLFEWHPKLCQKVGTDDQQAFRCLEEAGYDRYIFFTKFGQFSHFGVESINLLRRLCLTSSTLMDWHYDVLALHKTSPLDQVSIADLQRWGCGGW